MIYSITCWTHDTMTNKGFRGGYGGSECDGVAGAVSLEHFVVSFVRSQCWKKCGSFFAFCFDFSLFFRSFFWSSEFFSLV